MTSPVQKIINHTADNALHMSAAAAVGYLCARAFTEINPVTGAVFCAASYIVSKVVNPLFDKIFARHGANEASRTVGSVLSIATGIAASAVVASLVGFPISFTAGLVLTCSIVAVRIITAVGVTLAAATVG